VKRRRLLLMAVLLVALVLLGVTLLWVAAFRPGITHANFERIELGHRQADVEALLAGPPRDFSPHGIIGWAELHNGLRAPGHRKEVWGGDVGAVVVVFDEEGAVAAKDWQDYPLSITDNLFRWLLFR